ncbi:glucosamine-6-phosphate deaminase [Natronincola ferrireducens]|uniref:Glucosamine-6-phosphate deaminase n=1 Tax=Natronincola ferrireducens TaxID=393762 RepID=A0A1G9DX16_9FIRM|nr:glucosamine-6-phosphate deaminase [Natronincola ferrireducens]SDK68427.1 glucosamine-6-phosphate deaminase [Natronincola ferrireducens]
MKIIVVNDYEEMSRKAANIVASQIILKPNSVLGLATGDTPLGMYKNLTRFYQEGDVDFTDVKTFNLDEYYGLDKSNPQSYYFYMMENFFKHINIQQQNIHLPNGMAENIEKECVQYEKNIELAGGIDLQILGIGGNGHIGFNEPDLKFEAITHLVELDENTVKANSRFFKSLDEVPTKAISMGIKTIMGARNILLLASGRTKAEIIYKAIKGKITSEVPASILQLHPQITFIIDKEAASYL